MTEYEKLILLERVAHTIEITERSTGKVGVAQSFKNRVSVFYGKEDGNNDKIICPLVFNRDFRIAMAIVL